MFEFLYFYVLLQLIFDNRSFGHSKDHFVKRKSNYHSVLAGSLMFRLLEMWNSYKSVKHLRMEQQE